MSSLQGIGVINGVGENLLIAQGLSSAELGRIVSQNSALAGVARPIGGSVGLDGFFSGANGSEGLFEILSDNLFSRLGFSDQITSNLQSLAQSLRRGISGVDGVFGGIYRSGVGFMEQSSLVNNAGLLSADDLLRVNLHSSTAVFGGVLSKVVEGAQDSFGLKYMSEMFSSVVDNLGGRTERMIDASKAPVQLQLGASNVSTRGGEQATAARTRSNFSPRAIWEPKQKQEKKQEGRNEGVLGKLFKQAKEIFSRVIKAIFSK